MALERQQYRTRLTKCPFCGEDLRDRRGHAQTARHLENCPAFRETLGG